MSELPPPMGPLSYATPSARVPNPRPTSVTVIAVLAIIFGSIGVLGDLCGVAQQMGLRFGPNAVADVLRHDRVATAFTVFAYGVGVILAAVELSAGIGMLNLRPSARRAMILFAAVTMGATILVTLIDVLFISHRRDHALAIAMTSNPALRTPTVMQVRNFARYAGIVFALLSLIWPILILYFLGRPHVKAAFDRTGRDP